jgi:sugar diacid utilization regulator
VAVCRGDERDADRVRRGRAAYDVAALEADGRVTLLIRDPAHVQEALNVRGGGLSSTFTQLSDAPIARQEAEIAALCATAHPPLGPVAAYADLGGWAPIAELWTAAGRPRPPRSILALAGHRRGDQLIDALEGLLEHGGDVADAARGLSMHRATLYRRLERVEQITGLDLEQGDDRLLAHLGLRLLRLNATTVALSGG